MNKKELNIGQRFGSRTIINQLKERKNGYIMYEVKCDCGDVVKLNGSYLRSKIRPCKNCSAKLKNKKGFDHYNFKHGHSTRVNGKNPLYHIWVSMRYRCSNPNDKQYKDYGGRGIKVCTEWDDFEVFLKDMGPRPPGHQIDRIDNNGDYCKENCRWTTSRQQNNNKRNNTTFKLKGKIITRIDIQNKLKWTRDMYRRRLEKYGIEWILKNYENN